MERQLSAGQLEFPFDGGRLCLDLVERWDADTKVAATNAFAHRPISHVGSWRRDWQSVSYVLMTRSAAGSRATGGHLPVRHCRNAPATRACRRRADHQVAAWPIRTPRLDPTSGRLYWVSRRPLRAAMATVARDALEMLGSDAIDRVKECAAPDCSLLYLDASRAQRRRWCSMKRCQPAQDGVLSATPEGEEKSVSEYRRPPSDCRSVGVRTTFGAPLA